MTSALRGGVSPKEDVVREVAWVTIHRFYRLRYKTNSSLRPTIIRSTVIASTVLMSTILRSTQNDLHQNCFYIINVYRS